MGVRKTKKQEEDEFDQQADEIKLNEVIDSSDEEQSDSGDEEPLTSAEVKKTNPKSLISSKNAKKLSDLQAKKAESGEEAVVYVGRLPKDFDEEAIKTYFSQFGTINKIRLARSKKTGASKHYGWIEFAFKEVAEIVVETMNNYLIANHVLRCSIVPPENLFEKLLLRPKINPNHAVEKERANLVTGMAKDKSLRLEKRAFATWKKTKLLKAAGIDYQVLGSDILISKPAKVKNVVAVSKEVTTETTATVTVNPTPIPPKGKKSKSKKGAKQTTVETTETQQVVEVNNEGAVKVTNATKNKKVTFSEPEISSTKVIEDLDENLEETNVNEDSATASAKKPKKGKGKKNIQSEAKEVVEAPQAEDISLKNVAKKRPQRGAAAKFETLATITKETKVVETVAPTNTRAAKKAKPAPKQVAEASSEVEKPKKAAQKPKGNNKRVKKN